MKFDKLVRDKIPQKIKSNGEMPITHTASEEEYWQKIKEKLIEEAKEFCEKGDEEELADVLEVIYSICDYKKIDRKKLEELRRKKEQERGSFKERIILDETR
jgi:predicted house-cleaning noncanonical NTP pyrophosphatase (MazG superfamily)